MFLSGLQIVLIIMLGIAVLGVALAWVYRLTSCPACRGRGYIAVETIPGAGPDPAVTRDCPKCKGTGRP